MGFPLGVGRTRVRVVLWAFLVLFFVLPLTHGLSFEDRLRVDFNVVAAEPGFSRNWIVVSASPVVDSAFVSNVTSAFGPSNVRFSRRFAFVKGSFESVSLLGSDPVVGEVWLDEEVHASDEAALRQMNAPVAWHAGFSGAGVRIAVLDSGIDAAHPALAGRILNAHNFSSSPTVSDVLGHGTHVAAIAAGSGDVNGVAPDAWVLNAKVLNDQGTGSFSSVIEGIDWAIQEGADVINVSLGAPLSVSDTPLNLAVEDAVNAGVVVVVASGNCGVGCPSVSCNGFSGVTVPGNSISALTVGAVNALDQHACFSGGQWVNASELKPDLSAPGVGIVSALPGGGSGPKSGTSMATPFVSGAAALVLEAFPDFSPSQVKGMLAASSVDLGSTGKDIEFGFGRLDVNEFWLALSDANDVPIPDANDVPSQDVNVLSGAFVFGGPSDLNRSEMGTFFVEHLPSGASEVTGASNGPFDTMIEFVVFDETNSVVDYNVIGPVEMWDLNHLVFPNVFLPERVGNFKVQALVYQNGELVSNAFGASELNPNAAERSVRVSIPSSWVSISNDSFPLALSKKQAFSFQVPVFNSGPVSFKTAAEIRFINENGNVAEVFDALPVELAPGANHSFEFNEPLRIGAGDYNVVVRVIADNRVVESSHAVGIRWPADMAFSTNAIPSIVEADGNSVLALRIQNPNAFPVEPSLHLLLWDGNAIVRSFFDGNARILASSSLDVNVPWVVSEAAKTYRLEIRLSDENFSRIENKTLTVVDNSPPVLHSIGPLAPLVWQDGFVVVNASYSDFSLVRDVVLERYPADAGGLAQPVERVRLIRQSGSDRNGVWSGSTRLALSPRDSLRLRACDSFGHCSVSNFLFPAIVPTPARCVGKLGLVVRDDDGFVLSNEGQDWIFAFKENNACALAWSTLMQGLPSIETLNRFDAVVWSTGNFFGPSIDANEAALLSAFAATGKKLVVEGADVSSEHFSDAFSQNVLSSSFATEVFVDGNSEETVPAIADWWNADWQSRLRLTILSTEAFSNGLVRVDLNASLLGSSNAFFVSHVQADYDDVRFVDDANHELFFWREPASDSTSPVFWLKLSDVEVTQSVFAYFNNPLAAHSPFDDFNATVPLVDDFSDGEFTSNPPWIHAGENDWHVFNQFLRNSSTHGTHYLLTDVDMADNNVLITRQHMWLAAGTSGEVVTQWFRTGTAFMDAGEITTKNIGDGSAFLFFNNATKCTAVNPMGVFFEQTLSRGPDHVLRWYIDGNLLCAVPIPPLGAGRWFGVSHAGLGETRVDSVFLSNPSTTGLFVQSAVLESSSLAPSENALRLFFPLEGVSWSSVSFDANRSRYGDLVRPLSGAVPLFGLDANKLVGVAQLTDCPLRRTAFVSTSFDAFSPSQVSPLLENILDYLDQNAREPCEPPEWES